MRHAPVLLALALVAGCNGAMLDDDTTEINRIKDAVTTGEWRGLFDVNLINDGVGIYATPLSTFSVQAWRTQGVTPPTKWKRLRYQAELNETLLATGENAATAPAMGAPAAPTMAADPQPKALKEIYFDARYPQVPVPDPGKPSLKISLDRVTQSANVQLERPAGGKLLLDEDKGQTKVFVDHTYRGARLTKINGRWVVQRLTAFEIAQPGTKLAIKSVQVSVNGEQKLNVTDPYQLVATENLPVLKLGDKVLVEVKAASDDTSYAPAFYPYLHTPNDGSKTLMVDDGTNGDRIANDGIYTASFTAPKAGVHYFSVDVIGAVSFDTAFPDKYDAMSWGINYQVK